MRQNRSPDGNSITFLSTSGLAKKPCCAAAGEDRINNPGIKTAKSLRFIVQPSHAMARADCPRWDPSDQVVGSLPVASGVRSRSTGDAPHEPGNPDGTAGKPYELARCPLWARNVVVASGRLNCPRGHSVLIRHSDKQTYLKLFG
ncbi:hypothetical protein [Microvirga sp. KLBC 81]|uniref:hypothetical protein n=1 Tax=Microvirga sp. KLBC 81 TaxID=1862707 RepID=UPI001057EB6B|nr:hypothetical protein [Microvirga sp. KLBC 81]